MTDKQQIFADEYLIDLNGTRAYKVAYPNVKKDSSARVNASKLLTNTNIKNYIDKRLEEMRNERTAGAQEVLEYLTAIMRGDHTEQTLIGMGEGSQDVTDIDVGAKDRIKAAELLGKRHRLFTDKVELETTAVVTIVDDIGDTNGS